jgi:hypothetical protein
MMKILQIKPLGLKFVLPLIVLLFCSSAAFSGECVILLHGLARTDNSMGKLEQKLKKYGYTVANVNYPSRKMAIQELSEIAIGSGLAQCKKTQVDQINFVTHSLGGILVRYYYSVNDPSDIGRVVMLGPPNKGSQIVDNLKKIPGYTFLNGPAGLQLGTDGDSVPVELGPVNFALGVIAGTKSINPILSQFLPNPDDGKVAVENTKVEGMCGFVALPTSHPIMMNNKNVIREVISFLDTGKFTDPKALTLECAG